MSIERLKAQKEKILSCVESQDLKDTNAEEMGEAIDMIKDLSMAIYYCTITEGMEKGTEENEAMEKAMAKLNSMDNKNNAYYPMYYPPMYYTPMTRDEQWRTGRMYHGDYPDYYEFSYEYPVRYANMNTGNTSNSGNSMNGNNARGGGTRGYTENGYIPSTVRDAREGKSGMARRMYVESREMQQDNNTQIMKLKEYMNDLTDDITEVAQNMTPEQKQMFQQNIAKISNLISQMK